MDARLERILSLARWAPSGDNTQPWRFEVLSPEYFVVHGSDTRDWCVYDLEGRASQLAIGALLENIKIAARSEGAKAEFTIRDEVPETAPEIEVRLLADTSESIEDCSLLPFLEQRVTQRRALKTDSLRLEHKKSLEESVEPKFSVLWLDEPRQKREMARLLFLNAKIRLTIPEAFEVHRRIIEWNAQYSEDRIPDQAVGLDPINLKAMQWALQSWNRVVFLNRYLAGTLLPRISLDLIPALRCGAHFCIVFDKEPSTLEEYIEGGRAMQRIWLTSTSCGLQFQPEMTPLIFSQYAMKGLKFTQSKKALEKANVLNGQLCDLIGRRGLSNSVFMGRIGYGDRPVARSVRLPLDDMLLNSQRPQARDNEVV